MKLDATVQLLKQDGADTRVLALKSLHELLDGSIRDHREDVALTGGLLDALGSFLAPASLVYNTARLAITCLYQICYKSSEAARQAMFNSPAFAAVVHALLQPQTSLLEHGYALLVNVANSVKKKLFEFPGLTEALEQGLGCGDADIVESCTIILNHITRGLVFDSSLHAPLASAQIRELCKHGLSDTFRRGCDRLHKLIDTDGKAEDLLLAHPHARRVRRGQGCESGAWRRLQGFRHQAPVPLHRRHQTARRPSARRGLAAPPPGQRVEGQISSD